MMPNVVKSREGWELYFATDGIRLSLLEVSRVFVDVGTPGGASGKFQNSVSTISLQGCGTSGGVSRRTLPEEKEVTIFNIIYNCTIFINLQSLWFQLFRNCQYTGFRQLMRLIRWGSAALQGFLHTQDKTSTYTFAMWVQTNYTDAGGHLTEGCVLTVVKNILVSDWLL
jgi:hypothetical protein